MGAVDQSLVQEVYQSNNLTRPETYRKFTRVKGKYKSKVKKGERTAEDSSEEVSSWTEICEIVAPRGESEVLVIEDKGADQGAEDGIHDEVKFGLKCLEEYSEANKNRFISFRGRIYKSLPARDTRVGKDWARFFETQETLQIVSQTVRAAGFSANLDPKTHMLTDTAQIPTSALIGERVKVQYELIYDPETGDEDGKVVGVFPAPQS